MPFLHLLENLFHVHGCLRRGRYQLCHGPSMLGYQESFAAAHPIKESWRGISGLLQIAAAARRGDYEAPLSAEVSPTGVASP